MKMTNSVRRLAAWLACFAVLLAALAPAVSHAVAASKGNVSGWGDICSTSRTSATGARLDGLPNQPAAPQAGHFEHCPFCATHATPPGLPPAQALPFCAPSVSEAPPPLFLHSHAPLFAWAIARSRAPPRPR